MSDLYVCYRQFFPQKSNSMMLVEKLLTSAYKTKSVISTITRPQ